MKGKNCKHEVEKAIIGRYLHFGGLTSMGQWQCPVENCKCKNPESIEKMEVKIKLPKKQVKN